MARQRWPAFSLSLLLHVGTLSLLTWIDIAFQPPPAPQYQVLPISNTIPDNHKIIWYNFRKAVPEVTPDQPFGPSKTPHGMLDPSQTLVTIAPAAAPTRQIILQPDLPKPLPADVPAPNLVAIKVKLPPKAFTPPAPHEAARAAIPAVIDQPSPTNITTPQTANAVGALALLQKLPPRPFVAPAANSGGTRVAPHLDAPESQSLTPQPLEMSGLQAVMIGLDPSATLPPPGSRSGQIARAPEAGAPSSGATLLPGATIVPRVLSHGLSGEIPTPHPSPATQSNPEQRPVREVVLPGVNRTMSVPLRPSSRVIPAVIEARFPHRNVYTLVIPGPAVSGYGGDWIMWFGEREPDPESETGVRILAPLPARKYDLADRDPDPRGLPASASVEFAAIIDKTGHISSTTVLRGADNPVVRQRALEEMESWEFKPALRNGVPMDVDAVVEIPFRFLSVGAVTR